MTAHLRSVLLVDDSEADNFLHRRAIERSGLVADVVVQPDGEAALDFLRTCAESGQPLPELVLVDINMPRMTGWEFLDDYADLPSEIREQSVLYVVSGTLNPADHARAEASPVVAGFRQKSLTREMLSDIVNVHFTESDES